MLLSNSAIYFDESSLSMQMSNNTSVALNVSQSSLQNTIVKQTSMISCQSETQVYLKSESKKNLKPLPKQKSRIRKSKKVSDEKIVSKEFEFKELDKEEFIEEANNNLHYDNKTINISHLFGDISLGAITKDANNFAHSSIKQGSSNSIKSVFCQNKKVDKIQLLKSQFSNPVKTQDNCFFESSESLDIEGKSEGNCNGTSSTNSSNNSNNFSFLQIEFESLQETSSNFYCAAQAVENCPSTQEDKLQNSKISSQLVQAQEPVNQIINHMIETDNFIQQNYSQYDIYSERKRNFDSQVQNIIQNQSKNDSTPFFYIKTFANYKSKSVENKEIGYSRELLNLLKLNKNTHEFINFALRNDIPEIFGVNFNQFLSLYFLENLINGSSTQYTDKQFCDNILSFDEIQIPAKLSLQKINIPFQSQVDPNLQFIDNFVTIIKISIDSQVKSQIASLRCKLQKRQSFRYRTLFPTMQKRKQKIDKFFKNQQSQLKISQYLYIQNFLEKFYPKQLNRIENELNIIKNDLEANKSNKTVINNLLDHIIKI
ncbi:hypothetical protein TTHERM_01026210 (macronuclear) [Tetrahymena thermophila SB210]|uniref:Uncharacterized protein n=1 Tax=Tetrahymena thermophila (strain SB210) TaxID=312017 RepID=Q22CQ8_TETTS|nr:hypothetical protein TTHERM_01026210 [Tetrahymena thermophila SB210]EAR83057.2 hypothetical protein TTHERM_01026210 [Tetrahymena thermophila SB210]|eukprot:XP_001030720.2 hypothetical protein TTHERM_01026210 [Tetrahymena thermophila SB210]